MNKFFFCAVIAVVLAYAPAFGQVDTLKAHLEKINKFYDSTSALAFDVRYVYSSDTLNGDYEYRENQGEFIIDGNRFYYKMDLTECVQTDSFLLTILEKEKLMMVTSPQDIQSGKLVPARELIDTMVAYDFLGYSFSIDKNDSLNSMVFTTTDTTSIYNYMAVYYDPASFAMLRFELGFKVQPQELDTISGPPQYKSMPVPERQMRLQIYFNNYRVANITEDLFDIERYLAVDGRGVWVGQGRYAEFMISKLYN